jgi:pimeloyl-ACP methyl ester carboxylesterase
LWYQRLNAEPTKARMTFSRTFWYGGAYGLPLHMRREFGRKEYNMELPAAIQGESLKRLLQGFALGAVAAITVGFSWGGWTLGSTAAKQSATGATAAVVAALAPICAQNFQADVESASNLKALMAETSYKRTGTLEKAGWATFSGAEKPTPGVAKECVQLLAAL